MSIPDFDSAVGATMRCGWECAWRAAVSIRFGVLAGGDYLVPVDLGGGSTDVRVSAERGCADKTATILSTDDARPTCTTLTN